jgi:hypothetical protein
LVFLFILAALGYICYFIKPGLLLIWLTKWNNTGVLIIFFGGVRRQRIC